MEESDSVQRRPLDMLSLPSLHHFSDQELIHELVTEPPFLRTTCINGSKQDHSWNPHGDRPMEKACPAARFQQAPVLGEPRTSPRVGSRSEWRHGNHQASHSSALPPQHPSLLWAEERILPPSPPEKTSKAQVPVPPPPPPPQRPYSRQPREPSSMQARRERREVIPKAEVLHTSMDAKATTRKPSKHHRARTTQIEGDSIWVSIQNHMSVQMPLSARSSSVKATGFKTGDKMRAGSRSHGPSLPGSSSISSISSISSTEVEEGDELTDYDRYLDIMRQRRDSAAKACETQAATQERGFSFDVQPELKFVDFTEQEERGVWPRRACDGSEAKAEVPVYGKEPSLNNWFGRAEQEVR